METINKKDLIPVFKKSILVEQFDDEITIPKKYIFTNFKIITKHEIIINDIGDFNKVMDQLRYFMFKELPHEIYDYVIENKPDLSNFKDFFFEELTLLKNTNKKKLMNNSAKKGYLNLMKYLYDKRYSWHPNTCYTAALNGNLDCLKYAHENGCSWSSSLCYFAVENGHLNCLKYAIENGCPFYKQNCINNAKKHKHIVEYLENLDH